jgi:hypothetical protein
MINKAEKQMLGLAGRRAGLPVLSQPCGKPHIYMLSLELLPYEKGSESKHSDKRRENRSRDRQVAPKGKYGRIS